MTKITDEQQQIDNDEISLKELIQKIQEWIAYLRSQWKLIIGIAVGLCNTLIPFKPTLFAVVDLFS